MLSDSPSSRDELSQVGPSRSNPCPHPVRLVAVRGQGVWSRYLTHVRAPQRLSARHVCERYRHRWRLEEACALTTRRWDVAYVGTGSINAVPWQRSATLIFSAVLVTLWQQVALALGHPLERISVARVCRAFSHDRRAVQRGACHELVPCLVEHANLLGLVKRWRKQHRERQRLESSMWGDPSVETGGTRIAPMARQLHTCIWSRSPLPS